MHPGLKLTTPRQSAATRERGAVAVEFALVLPVLLLIVFGVIDFGIVLAQKASLASAARAGARFGAVNAYTATHSCSNVVKKVRDNAQTIGIGTSNSKQVGVKVTRIDSAGISHPACHADPGLDTSEPTAPCTDATATPAAPGSLQIDVSFQSNLLVSVPGLGHSVGLANSATYQCEYH
jgi:Flp pilus assembly protein TadG